MRFILNIEFCGFPAARGATLPFEYWHSARSRSRPATSLPPEVAARSQAKPPSNSRREEIFDIVETPTPIMFEPSADSKPRRSKIAESRDALTLWPIGSSTSMSQEESIASSSEGEMLSTAYSTARSGSWRVSRNKPRNRHPFLSIASASWRHESIVTNSAKEQNHERLAMVL